MLSFDISAIDIVLLIAVIVLLLLTAQRRGQVSSASAPLVQGLTAPSARLETTNKNGKKKPSTVPAPKSFRECVHDFGYLKDLPRNTPVPDECFGCPQVMRCLFPSEQSQTVQQ